MQYVNLNTQVKEKKKSTQRNSLKAAKFHMKTRLGNPGEEGFLEDIIRLDSFNESVCLETVGLIRHSKMSTLMK